MNFNIYSILAIAIIAIFYTAYIVKMLVQRRKGIKTDQLSSGVKPKHTYYIELILKTITYSIVIVEVVSVFRNYLWFDISWLRIIGVCVAFIGTVIFISSMIVMKDNWRAGVNEEEKTSLVTSGLYKYSRNPAFVGFDLLYVGIFLIFPNIAHLLFVISALFIFHLQILEEEKFLSNIFGKEYDDYKKNVRRYL